MSGSLASLRAFGQELRERRQQAGLSVRRAAKMAGISEGRWRQLESGVKPVGGGSVAVRTTPETALKVARVVQLPDDHALTLAGFDPKVFAGAVLPQSSSVRREHANRTLTQAADAAPRALGEFIGTAVAVVLMDHAHDEHPDPNVHELAHRVLMLARLGGSAGVVERGEQDG